MATAAGLAKHLRTHGLIVRRTTLSEDARLLAYTIIHDHLHDLEGLSRYRAIP